MKRYKADLSLFVLIVLTMWCGSAHCQTKPKETYMLYLVEFAKDTLIIKMSDREPGRVPATSPAITAGTTVVTILDDRNNAVYQTTLPLIPQRGEVYPVCVPVSRDNYRMLAEGVKDGFKYKRLGGTPLRSKFFYRDIQQE